MPSAASRRTISSAPPSATRFLNFEKNLQLLQSRGGPSREERARDRGHPRGGEERDAVLGDGRAAAGRVPGGAVGARPARRARSRYPSLRAVDRWRAMALPGVRRVAGAAVHAVLALRRLPN